MIALVTTLVLTTAVAVGSVPPNDHERPISAAMMTAFTPSDASSLSRLERSQPNDPLKNGAITGAIAGGLAVAVLATAGCAVGSVMGGDSSCTGPVLVGTAVGAGLGALIGVGIDAMFDQAPQHVLPSGSRRKGIRLHLRF